MPYNLFTCKGFEGAAGWIASKACFQARIGIVIVFFLIAILRKWVFQMAGLPYNFLIAEGSAILSYILLITLTGSSKIALGISILVGCILGYFGGVYGGDDSSDG